jgi:peroxiredoxin
VLSALPAVLAATMGLSAAVEEKPAAPAIGATVSDFTLKDIRRRPRALADYKDKKAVVVVFVGTECPLANLYVPTLIDLHKEYAPKGVQLLLINSNEQDSFPLVSAHALERDIPFPVLKDFDHKVADLFGAKRTPEAFVLDEKRVIRYTGRIDDQYGIGYQKAKPTRQELKTALDELLAGKPVSTPKTEAPGCLIARARPSSGEKVTYAKQVSRILQKRCQECHRPGEIGPMSLLTYEKAKSWADMIHEVVLEQRMPPWHPDPRHGKFSNDRRLTEEERATLLRWVEEGCARGDDKDLPPPKQFVDGWKIGEPDAIFQMKDEFTVPAAGVLNYKRFTVDPGFKEDVWIQAAECRPGNRAVVHHIIVYMKRPGKDVYDKDGRAWTVSGWAPGDMPAIYPPDVAKMIPAGSQLVFEVHYTPNGKEQTDRSSVGIVYAKKPPKFPTETNILAQMKFLIPAGKKDHKSELAYTFRDDALVYSFMPHMHLRGVGARYDLTLPDGKKETLLSVPDYDFNWQSVYRFEKPLRVPKGAKLTVTGWWDNSADNPRNPDPKKEIRWGLQTWDEMMNGWMEVVWQPGGKKP